MREDRRNGQCPRDAAAAVRGGWPSRGADKLELLELRKDKCLLPGTGAQGLTVSRRANTCHLLFSPRPYPAVGRTLQSCTRPRRGPRWLVPAEKWDVRDEQRIATALTAVSAGPGDFCFFFSHCLCQSNTSLSPNSPHWVTHHGPPIGGDFEAADEEGHLSSPSLLQSARIFLGAIWCASVSPKTSGEVVQLLSKPMGSHELPHLPRAVPVALGTLGSLAGPRLPEGPAPRVALPSLARWQPVLAGEGRLGSNPVGGPWWDAFTFPQENRFLHTKAMASE